MKFSETWRTCAVCGKANLNYDELYFHEYIKTTPEILKFILEKKKYIKYYRFFLCYECEHSSDKELIERLNVKSIKVLAKALF